MSSHSIVQRAPRRRCTEQPLRNSAFGPDGDDGNDEGAPISNGWFDSSFELRQGLEVIEWMLPDWVPGKPRPT